MEPVGTTSVVDAAAPLYSHAALAQVGATIKHMLETYEAQGVGAVNPLLASIVLEIRARLIQLAAGLDFLGMPTDIVPIWSFEFLQSVARYFAQQAVHAEREFIGFTDRGENEEFSRQQLEQQVALAGAEKELAKQQRMAAEAEQKAYDEAETLAETRALNAQANRNDYAAMSTERIALETSNAWYSAQNPWELDNTIEGEGPDAGRHVHEVIAENTKKRGRIVREYELAAMDRQTAEMQQAEVVAAAQAAAADARVSAAKQMEDVAKLREDAAKDNLEAFDTQFFTPDVWFQMAQFMRNISASYMYKAVRTARLMQRAYNFENDLTIRVTVVREKELAAVVASTLAACVPINVVTSDCAEPYTTRVSVVVARCIPHDARARPKKVRYVLPRKVDRDGHENRHGHAVQKRRRVLPLPHGVKRGLVEQRDRPHYLRVYDFPVGPNRRFDRDRPSDTRRLRNGGVDRLDVLDFFWCPDLTPDADRR